MPHVYEIAELPRRSRLGISGEMLPYVDALRSGKAIGDGVAYSRVVDARRVAMKFWARAQKILVLESDPGARQQVWDRDGKFFWALIPN